MGNTTADTDNGTKTTAVPDGETNTTADTDNGTKTTAVSDGETNTTADSDESTETTQTTVDAEETTSEKTTVACGQEGDVCLTVKCCENQNPKLYCSPNQDQCEKCGGPYVE